jgi:hypothetical protein
MPFSHDHWKNKSYGHRPRNESDRVPLWQFQKELREKRERDRVIVGLRRETETLKGCLHNEKKRATEYMVKLREVNNEFSMHRMHNIRKRKELEEELKKMKEEEKDRIRRLEEDVAKRVRNDKRMMNDYRRRSREEKERKRQLELLEEDTQERKDFFQVQKNRQEHGSDLVTREEMEKYDEFAIRKLSWKRWRERNVGIANQLTSPPFE